MFLDEELEECYKNCDTYSECTQKMFAILWNRLPKPYTVSPDEALIKIKQIDNGWRLFCSRHKEFKPDGFRKIVLQADEDGKFKKALNW